MYPTCWAAPGGMPNPAVRQKSGDVQSGGVSGAAGAPGARSAASRPSWVPSTCRLSSGHVRPPSVDRRVTYSPRSASTVRWPTSVAELYAVAPREKPTSRSPSGKRHSPWLKGQAANRPAS